MLPEKHVSLQTGQDCGALRQRYAMPGLWLHTAALEEMKRTRIPCQTWANSCQYQTDIMQFS